MILYPLNSRFAQTLAATALLTAGASLSRAATYTWKGGGADNSWKTAANWQGNTVPPSGTSTDLIFGNTAFDDLSIGSAFGIHSLTFSNDASTYNFSSGPLALGAGGIDEESANAQSFNVTVALATDQTWQLANGAGQLNFARGINTSDSGGAGHVLTINANSTGSAANIINGVISGKGSLVKTGVGTLTLSGANTYTGATTVNAGTLSLGSGGSILGTSALSVNPGATMTLDGTGQLAGAGSAAMHLTGTAASLATLNLGGTGSLTLPGNAFLDTNSRVNQTGGMFTSANLTLGSTGGNNIYALSGAGSVATGVLTVGDIGGGTFNHYNGTVTAASLKLGGSRGGSSTGVYNLNQGTLATGSITGNSYNGIPQGVLNFHGGVLQPTTSSLHFLENLSAANVRGSTNASGVQSGGAIINVGSGIDVLIAQPLRHSPVAGDAAIDGGFTMLGSGSIILSGNNTYTGPTVINEGYLMVGYGGATGTLGSGPVINNGGLGFGRGDDIIVSNAISGTGSLGLGNLSATVTLTGTSTYTGPTTVGYGKLVVTSGGSIASGQVTVFSGGSLAIEGTGSVSTVNNSILEMEGQGTLTDQGKVSLSGYAGIGIYQNGTFTQSGGSFTTNRNQLILAYASDISGKYTLSNGSLSTGFSVIGYGGKGNFAQSGGTFTSNGSEFVVGYLNGSTGNFDLSGTGSLSTGIAYIGFLGPGTFTQSGGTFTTNNHDFNLGGNVSGPGSFTLSGTGGLSTGITHIGYLGTGTFTQSGGTFTTNGKQFYIGMFGNTGSYTMSGGNLSTGYLGVGFSGPGTFTQTGGSVTSSGSLFTLGGNPGSGGTYALSGTGSLSASNPIIGAAGSGIFTQSGGTFTTNGTRMTVGSGGNGSYLLSGGTLTTSYTQVGDNSTSGTFTQTGGTHTTGTLALTGITTASVGTYNLDGGVLSTGRVTTGDNGTSIVGTSTFNFNGGTLQSSTNNASYFSGVTTANVRAGGALIDTNGFNVTIAQSLVHSTIGGDNATIDGGLIKNGAGTLTLTGTNTFTGGARFNAGTVNAGSPSALGSTGPLNFTGGTLQYSAANTTDYSSRFGTASPQTFIIDTNSQNVTFASGIAGSGNSLTKLGLGTLTLTGTNAFPGGVAISRGVLNAGSVGALGTSGTISFGGVLQYSGANQTDYSNRFSRADYQYPSIDTNGQNVTFATGFTSPHGGLTKAGAGTLTLTGANTYGFTTQINGGTLALATGGSISDSYILVAGGGTFNVTGGTVGPNSGAVEFGTTAGLATGNFSSGTLNAFTGYVGYVPGSTGVFNQTGGSSNTGMYVGVASGSNGTYNLSGGIQTAGVIVGYGGNGTLTQSGGTMRGGVDIGYNAGGVGLYTLNSGELTGGILVGVLGTGTFTQNGGSITSSDLIVANAGGGVGTFNLNGGTFSINEARGDGGVSTFNFNGGTMQATASRTNFFQGFTTANVKAGGAKIDTNGFNITVQQTLLHDAALGNTLDGGLTKLGAGSLTLAAPNTYTGTTTVDGGTLIVIANGALGESDVTIDADATLSLGVGVTAAHNGDGDSTLTLASANTSIVDLAGSGVQDVVGTLIIEGVRMAAGTYGAPGSGAIYTNLSDFTGTGVLTVVPEPGICTLLSIALCLSGVIVWSRRSRRDEI